MIDETTLRTHRRQAVRFADLEIEDYPIPAAILDRLQSPALVIFLEHVRSNVRRVIELLGDEPRRWRPHVKTAKLPLVVDAYLDAGVRDFKCATTREARMVLETIRARGIDDGDLLIAYPHQGPAMRAASELAARYSETAVSMLTDSPSHAGEVPRNLDLFLDINPHMNRTGIPIADLERIECVARVAGERMRGLHAYEGHIHDESAQLRSLNAEKGYRELLDACALLSTKGLEVSQLVTSGTPTFLYAHRFFEPSAFERAGLSPIPHQVSPGTVVFFDYDYGALLEDLPLTPAALLLTRVVSHPAPSLATIDVGSKSLACEIAPPLCYVVGHPELIPTKPSEEHLPLFVDSGEPPRLGTELRLVPRHICPTVNLADEALVIESDGTCKVVRVVARSHDLLID